MPNITPDQFMSAIVVLLAIFAAIATVDKVIDIVRKWRTPTAETTKMLANDKRRLDDHEEAIENLRESIPVICSTLLALLDHELHNGNTDQMEMARNEMMAYLSKHIAK